MKHVIKKYNAIRFKVGFLLRLLGGCTQKTARFLIFMGTYPGIQTLAPSALNANVKKFKKARVNGGGYYDSLKDSQNRR